MKYGMRFLCLFFISVLLLAGPSAGAEASPPVIDIQGRAAVLMDAGAGTVLFAKNETEQLQIASVTKIMTMLIIMEAIHTGRITEEEMVTASEYACSMGGSQIYLEPGEQMSVRDMLKAIAVASGNDASVAMAEHIMGTSEAFVGAMNTRAKALGMKDTVFQNCNGLDAPGQHSSARDVAIMSRELLRHERIKAYLTIWMDTLRDGAFGLSNTNKLVRFYNGAVGIKTGSTDEAKYCLSGAAERNGLTLIAVVLGADTSAERFNSTTKLLDYGFANYTLAQGAVKGEVYGTVTVQKGEVEAVDAVAKEDFNKLITSDKKGTMETQVNLPDYVIAPLKEGDKVGEMVFTLDGAQLGRVELVAKEAVPGKSVWSMFVSILKVWTLS